MVEASGASPSSDVARQSGGLEDSSLIYDEPDEEYTPEEFESLLRQMQLDHNGSPSEGGHLDEQIVTEAESKCGIYNALVKYRPDLRSEFDKVSPGKINDSILFLMDHGLWDDTAHQLAVGMTEARKKVGKVDGEINYIDIELKYPGIADHYSPEELQKQLASAKEKQQAYKSEGIQKMRQLMSYVIGIIQNSKPVAENINENLDPRSLVNVYTPEFKSWFKNSKAVDDDGSPIVFFRGARRVPKSDKFGTLGGRATPSFVASADIASVYAATRGSFGVDYNPGAAVYPVFLSIQNPVDLRDVFEINLEYDLISILNSDWDNEQEFEYALGIIEELWNFESNGIPFKYELPIGHLGNMDWEDLISNLRKYYAKGDLESVTSLLGLTYVDIFAIFDTKSFTNWAREKGFDGVVHVDVFDIGAKYASELLGKESASGLDEENQHTTWRPFYPAQVKSIFNVGKWSSKQGSPMTENSGKEILSDVKTYSPEFLAKKHNVPLEQIKDELKKGIQIEFEHTLSRKLSKEIALDHLLELPDYYTKLEKMETGQRNSSPDLPQYSESKFEWHSFGRQYKYPNPLPLADENIFMFVLSLIHI